MKPSENISSTESVDSQDATQGMRVIHAGDIGHYRDLALKTVDQDNSSDVSKVSNWSGSLEQQKASTALQRQLGSRNPRSRTGRR